jgi:hypothetical protein
MKLQVMICALVVGFLAGSVLADDILPPPWQRGSDRTTYQDWTFATNTNPTGPDVGIINPYGVPTATVSGGAWAQYYDNHVGVWTLLNSDSFINVPIANAPDHLDWTKNLWIQLTWQPNSGGSPNLLVDGRQTTLHETDLLPNTNWFHSTYTITLPYNPAMETVHLTGFVDLGEIVVDTQCIIPEPATLSLMALAGLALIRRRK